MVLLYTGEEVSMVVSYTQWGISTLLFVFMFIFFMNKQQKARIDSMREMHNISEVLTKQFHSFGLTMQNHANSIDNLAKALQSSHQENSTYRAEHEKQHEAEKTRLFTSLREHENQRNGLVRDVDNIKSEIKQLRELMITIQQSVVSRTEHDAIVKLFNEKISNVKKGMERLSEDSSLSKEQVAKLKNVIDGIEDIQRRFDSDIQTVYLKLNMARDKVMVAVVKLLE
jgi:chromosome segregation ATPase